MSALPGNPFAESLTGYDDPRNSLEAVATLALAYEQRTANLLAFERSQWEAWKLDDLNPEGQALWRRAADQLIGRLGLS